MALPRVSCLLLFRPRHAPRVLEAIDAYCRQTYEPRQLVLAVMPAVAEPERSAVTSYVAALERPDIAVLEPEAGPAGALLDLAAKEARGPLLCRWESDLRHHSERLKAQYDAICRMDTLGCCFTDQLYYRRAGNVLTWVDLRSGAPTGSGGLIADTLLWWRRNCVAHTPAGDPLAFVHDLARLERIIPLEGCGHLTIRYDPLHDPDGAGRFAAMARRHGVPAALLRNHRGLLERELRSYDWDVPVLSVREKLAAELYTVDV